jgi:hypothetical protein
MCLQILIGLVLLFEAGSHCTAQVGLKLKILLPQPLEHWDYRCAPPCRALKFSSPPHQFLLVYINCTVGGFHCDVFTHAYNVR